MKNYKKNLENNLKLNLTSTKKNCYLYGNNYDYNVVDNNNNR